MCLIVLFNALLESAVLVDAFAFSDSRFLRPFFLGV